MAFLYDTFTDAADTALVDHVGEVGAAWTYHPTVEVAVPLITATGELRHGDTSGSRILYASGVPASPDYTVTAAFREAGSPGDGHYTGIWARLAPGSGDGYMVQYAHGSGQFELLSFVADSFHFLDSWSGPASSATLSVQGDTIGVIVDGTTVIEVTNSDHADAGRVGVRFDFAGSDAADGIWLDNLTAIDLSAPPGQLWPHVHRARPLTGQAWPRA